MIAEPIPPFVPVTTLADRIKTWPMLAVHRFEEIEAVLLAFEARLIALEPKQAGKSIFAPAMQPGLVAKPAPFVPISPPVPIPAQPTPIPTPSVLPTPSFAQSDTFAGKSIFAPPEGSPPYHPYTPGVSAPPPTIFAPAVPPKP